MKGCWTLSVFGLLGLAACQSQLPQRQDVKLDQIPTIDTSTIISSNNGLLSDGIGKVPGSICVPDANGKCNPKNMVPSQCLTQGVTVEVKPITNPQPAYHSLIDNKYQISANVPFVSPSASTEYLEEIKAVISGTAQIKSLDSNNGYPGVEGIKECLLRAYGPGTYNTVYWISAANIIAVTKANFRQISSSTAVTATAFGANGSTYNHDGIDEENVWIGIYPHPIPVGTVAAQPGHPEAARVVTGTPSTIFVRPRRVPESLPPVSAASIVSHPQ